MTDRPFLLKLLLVAVAAVVGLSSLSAPRPGPWFALTITTPSLHFAVTL